MLKRISEGIVKAYDSSKRVLFLLSIIVITAYIMCIAKFCEDTYVLTALSILIFAIEMNFYLFGFITKKDISFMTSVNIIGIILSVPLILIGFMLFKSRKQNKKKIKNNTDNIIEGIEHLIPVILKY